MGKADTAIQTSNVDGFDVDGTVNGKSTSYFTNNLVSAADTDGAAKNSQNVETVIIPTQLFASYVNAVYNNGTSENSANGNGVGVNSKDTSKSIVNVYWELAQNANGQYYITGTKYVTSDTTTLANGNYFLGYVLKNHGDGYHIDGYKVTVANNGGGNDDGGNDNGGGNGESNNGTTTNDDVTATPVSAVVPESAVLGANRTPETPTAAETAAPASETAVLGARRTGAQTADGSYAAGWVSLMAVSAGCAVAFTFKRRRSDDID